MIAARDPLGVTRLFVDVDGARWARSVRPLLGDDGGVDAGGVRAAWALAPHSDRTCFARVRAVPIGHGLAQLSPAEIRPIAPPQPRGSLEQALHAWAERAPRGAALALSGGLDSAVALALLCASGRPPAQVISLRTPWPAYDEREFVAETARALGVRVEPVEVSTVDLRQAIDEAVAHAETCLWNLHPVARFLLARGAARRGHTQLITGDGADPLFARSPSEQLLPIVGALASGAGVALASPFLDPDVQAAVAPEPDPGKAALRAIAARLGLASLAHRPKTPRLTPPIPLGDPDPAFGARWEAGLGVPYGQADDAARVRWLTFASLSRTFGLTRCVA